MGADLEAFLALLSEPGQPAQLWQVRHVAHTCKHVTLSAGWQALLPHMIDAGVNPVKRVGLGKS